MKHVLVVIFFLLMIGCSSKKGPVPTYTDRWENLSGEYINKPVEIKVNDGVQSLVGHSSLNYQVAVSIPLRNPLNNGLPAESESKDLEKVEQALSEKLISTKLAVFAAVIKTDGRCDFIFYTGNQKAVKKQLDEIGKSIDAYTPDISIKRDDKWVTYTWFSQWR